MRGNSVAGGAPLEQQQPCHCGFTSGLPPPSSEQSGVMAESGSAMLPQLLLGPHFICLSPLNKQTLSSASTFISVIPRADLLRRIAHPHFFPPLPLLHAPSSSRAFAPGTSPLRLFGGKRQRGLNVTKADSSAERGVCLKILWRGSTG